MTLTELRYIVAVARERHFGHAAATCFVSQSTLSIGVRKLEDELGMPLFERSRNEVTLTAKGEQIVEQAQRVLEEVDVIKQMAESGKGPLVGALRIGAIHTIGPYLFPGLIPVLHEQAPEMPLLVQENYTANLTILLKQGQLDVIIISYPYEEPGIETLPLYDEPFVVVVPSAHPWAGKRTISREVLSEENIMLLGAGNCFRDQVLEFCPDCLQASQKDIGLQQTLEGSSLETIRHMVMSGIGISVFPVTAAGAHEYSHRLLAVKRLSGKQPLRRVALAWRKSFPRRQAIETLTIAIRQLDLSSVKMLQDLPEQ
ncbi:MAG TPA: hydrogen peroxide-inducible genes activator [Gammaproteobacteria bacterium]|nr:hydrogen peroxide-inducible genes activator [Gammaproteobacteria bacterium]